MTENGSGLTLGWSGKPQYINKNLNVMRMVNYSISKVTLKSARNGVPLTTRPRSAPVTMKNLRGQIAECKKAARINNKTKSMDKIIT